jgi:redox-sensitive bicupin YhaK (pirin superfamily)
MSPSDDFGEILRPFVFLDYLDHDVREPITSGLHPHSGIATVSHLTEGSVNYIDPDNVRGILPAGGLSGCRLDAECGTAAVSTLPAACEDSSSG